MEIEIEDPEKVADVVSSVLMLLLAVAFAIAAEALGVRYLHFFAGWFCRSAWIRMKPRSGLSRAELKAIKAGLTDAEAGRTVPLEQVREELRLRQIERERIRRQEVCSDETHWKS